MRKIDTQAGVIEYIKDRFETLEAIGTKYEELKGDFHILFYYVMWLETSVIKLRESGYDEDWIKQIEDVIERHVPSLYRCYVPAVLVAAGAYPGFPPWGGVWLWGGGGGPKGTAQTDLCYLTPSDLQQKNAGPRAPSFFCACPSVRQHKPVCSVSLQPP